MRLRRWQQQAYDDFRRIPRQDYLVTATPGAGKTMLAGAIARLLLSEGTVRRVSVVTPTDHLRNQWAHALHRCGLTVDPTWRNGDGRLSPEYLGDVVTYAQVAAAPHIHAARTRANPTLVILDEVHHAGDQLSWGEALRHAFSDAAVRLGLSGTPYRSDTQPIPWVRYRRDAHTGERHSEADYTYGYADALRDGVVRPVMFLAYDGEAQWIDRDGRQRAAQLSGPRGQRRADTQTATRVMRDPDGSWIRHVISAADARLNDLRKVIPDAASLLLASDQEHARAYARIITDITGSRPALAISDDRASSRQLRAFADSDARHVVAVRMVSEGVDIPRLAQLVLATNTTTPLFFAQAVGRVVRARSGEEVANVFLPATAALTTLAAEMEAARDHVLAEAPAADNPGATETVNDSNQGADDADVDAEGNPLTVLATNASFHQVIFDGHTIAAEDTGPFDDGFGGFPGLLDPEHTAMLMRAREAQHPQPPPPPRPPTTERAVHEQASDLRRELNRLVGVLHNLTGTPYGALHAELRRAVGGVDARSASLKVLERRVTHARRLIERARR